MLAAGCSSAPARFTVHGTVRVPDNPAAGEGSPVQVGDQVTITDPSGKVIGFTHLNGDADQGPTFTLTFGFTVQIPQGESSYGCTWTASPAPSSTPRSRCGKAQRSAPATPAVSQAVTATGRLGEGTQTSRLEDPGDAFLADGRSRVTAQG